jgi:hypothetical protein
MLQHPGPGVDGPGPGVIAATSYEAALAASYASGGDGFGGSAGPMAGLDRGRGCVDLGGIFVGGGRVAVFHRRQSQLLAAAGG